MPGSYCALVQCHHQETRDPCRFFRISRKNKAQTTAWTRAINRVNPDGSEWEPNSKSVICSCHFVGGEFSKDPSNPAYAPTILEPVVTPPKEDASIRKVPIVVSLPKKLKLEDVEKQIETKTLDTRRRRRGIDETTIVKQEIITHECDFCGEIFKSKKDLEIQGHNCLQEESSNTEKSGDHFMANSIENTSMPSRIIVSPPKKTKYDIIVKQEPPMYRDPNTSIRPASSKNTKGKSKQVIVVSLPKKSKLEVAAENINTEIVLPESFGPPVVDDVENVAKPEKARLKCDFCDIHLRSTGSVTTDRSTIRIHMKMEHPNEEIPTSNRFTKNDITSRIKESGNVNEVGDFETLVKQEPAEPLPAEPLEDPPTLAEFIESLQTARKFLESRSVSDREHESLLNLESFAIKEAEKHFS